MLVKCYANIKPHLTQNLCFSLSKEKKKKKKGEVTQVGLTPITQIGLTLSRPYQWRSL